MPSMKESLGRAACSICLSLYSHSPVRLGEVSVFRPMRSSRAISSIPRRVARSSRPSRTMYSWEISPSMMEARVAGVPRPRSLMAAASSSSCTSFPAPSMAASSVASLYRAGGLVMALRISISRKAACSPSRTGTSSSLEEVPAFRP